MSIKDDLGIPAERLRQYRELLTTWTNGNRKDVAQEVRDAGLPWVLMFVPYFVHRFGWAELGILIRLVEAIPRPKPVANDCHTRFSVRLPNGVTLVCDYCHNSGRFDICPDASTVGKVEPRVWDEASNICTELEGNYFYLSDVTKALRDVGIARDDLP